MGIFLKKSKKMEYITIEILKSCTKFVAGQIIQMPTTEAKRRISNGSAKLYDPKKEVFSYQKSENPGKETKIIKKSKNLENE